MPECNACAAKNRIHFDDKKIEKERKKELKRSLKMEKKELKRRLKQLKN